MNIEWIQAKRRPDWPGWAVALVAVWLTLGVLNLLLAARAGRQISLCLFKNLTGYPCPTCGFTRGALLFLSGHPLEGWLHNPLLFSLLGGYGVVIAIRVLLACRLAVHPSQGEKRAAWIVLSVLFAANWLYVIQYVG